jgi:hypothetical protein
LACPGCGIDFVSSSLSIVLIGGSVAFAVSALLTSCDEPALGNELCACVSGVGDEGPADEESDDNEGAVGGDVDSEDEAEGAGADGEVGVRAAIRCFAMSSERPQAASATLTASSETSAACIFIFI